MRELIDAIENIVLTVLAAFSLYEFFNYIVFR